jgi:2-oxoglutarate dehydrogenase complex dehydrogenase (E1) component-like enzyme
MHRDIRKPLIVITPKSLLRLPEARSRTEEFLRGHFQETLDDPRALSAEGVRRLLLCSGKVFYDLDAHRVEQGIADTAIVRIEQLYPWPRDQVLAAVASYPNLRDIRWVQEEPENMGADRFVHYRFHEDLPSGKTLSHAARVESGSPASGSITLHELEQRDLVRRAFAD